MSDAIPTQDLEVITKAKTVQTFVNTNLAALGLVAADVTAFTTKITTADTAMTTYQNAKTTASTTLAAKETAISDLTKEWRQLRRKVKGNANLTDAQRQGVGLSASTAMLMAVTATYTHPLVEVDNTARLKHVVRFREASTPSTKARPSGVKGADVWMVILPRDAAAPRDNSAMRCVGQPSSSPHPQTFSADDAGKIAWYLLRWVSTTGEPGDWSDPAGKMIVG